MWCPFVRESLPRLASIVRSHRKPLDSRLSTDLSELLQNYLHLCSRAKEEAPAIIKVLIDKPVLTPETRQFLRDFLRRACRHHCEKNGISFGSTRPEPLVRNKPTAVRRFKQARSIKPPAEGPLVDTEESPATSGQSTRAGEAAGYRRKRPAAQSTSGSSSGSTSGSSSGSTTTSTSETSDTD